MDRVYKTFFFRNQDWYSVDFGSRNPVLQKTKQRKYATSIVKRVDAEIYTSFWNLTDPINDEEKSPETKNDGTPTAKSHAGQLRLLRWGDDTSNAPDLLGKLVEGPRPAVRETLLYCSCCCVATLCR